MKIKVEKSFLLSHILKCGQTFRYEEVGEEKFFVIAGTKRVLVSQDGDEVDFSCSEREYKEFWQEYFNLDLNYGDVKKKLAKIEPKIIPYMDELYGIRILKQDSFEMMITFIISQNNSMTNIQKVVNRICEHFGEKFSDDFGDYYCFPSLDAFTKVSKEEFRELKTGFRDKYLVDAISRVASGELDLDGLRTLTTDKARAELMKVKGIGRKVADCILLFGFYRLDVFPIDVWTRRALTRLYYEGEKVKDDTLLDKAYEVFGDYSGIAQQYVFYWIVKENSKG